MCATPRARRQTVALPAVTAASARPRLELKLHAAVRRHHGWGSAQHVSVMGLKHRERRVVGSCELVIYLDFPFDLTGIFSGKHLIQYKANKLPNFWKFILHDCILIFDAEQVYLKHQVTNSRIKLQQTLIPANPNPNPYCFLKTLNPKP